VRHPVGSLCAPSRVATPTTTAVHLRDGAWVSLRDAGDDAQHLREMFFTLSDHTRYLFFCAGVPRNDLWADRVARLGIADGCASYALVAEVGGTVIGVARFDRDAHHATGEVGILLADAWQSRGLGREVVARLRMEAARRALNGFTATVLGENYRALRLLRRAFPGLRVRWSQGQGELDLPFDHVVTAQEGKNQHGS
jgi:RimJ/RimL family protein N-acetyltransferase